MEDTYDLSLEEDGEATNPAVPETPPSFASSPPLNPSPTAPSVTTPAPAPAPEKAPSPQPTTPAKVKPPMQFVPPPQRQLPSLTPSQSPSPAQQPLKPKQLPSPPLKPTSTKPLPIPPPSPKLVGTSTLATAAATPAPTVIKPPATAAATAAAVAATPTSTAIPPPAPAAAAVAATPTSTAIPPPATATTTTRVLLETPSPMPLALPGTFWLERGAITDNLVELLKSGGFTLGESCNCEEAGVVHSFVKVVANDGGPAEALRPFTSQIVEDFFASVREPFAVLTVCGDTRVGKSTLLNEFLESLGYKPCFGTSGLKSVACTAGIWFLPLLLPLQEDAACKVLLVDCEGFEAVTFNGKQDMRYFQKLFVASFFISSTMLFLIRCSAIDEACTSRLRKLGEQVHAFKPLGGNPESFHSNSPKCFAVVAQGWPMRDINADSTTWKRVNINFLREFIELFGSKAKFGSCRRFFSLPTLNDPQRTAKIADVLKNIAQLTEPATVASPSMDQPHSLQPGEFLPVVRTIIDAINGTEGLPSGDSIVDKLRAQARHEAYKAALKTATMWLCDSWQSEGEITPDNAHKDIEGAISQVEREIAAIFQIQQPLKGDTSDWTPEIVKQQLFEQLLQHPHILEARKRAVENCRQFAKALLSQLWGEPCHSREEFQRNVDRCCGIFRNQFGHFGEWAQPAFDEWDARVQEITDEFRHTAQIAAEETKKRAAAVYFASIGAQCPNSSNDDELFTAYKEALDSRLFSLPLGNLTEPSAVQDLHPLLEEYRRKIASIPGCFQIPNFEGELRKFLAVFGGYLQECASKVVQSVRAHIITMFLVPTFVENKHLPLNAFDFGSLSNLVDLEYFLKTVPRYGVDVLLFKKLMEAKQFYATVMQQKGVDIAQGVPYKELHTLCSDLDALAAYIHNLVPPSEFLLDMRWQCKPDESLWNGIRAMTRSRYVVTQRGFGRVEGHKTWWYTITFPTLEERNSFLQTIGAQIALQTNYGLHLSQASLRFVYFGLQGPINAEVLVSGISNSILSQVGVLPLGAEGFACQNFGYQGHVFVVAFTTEEDFARMCGSEFMVSGARVTVSPCPLLQISGVHPSVVIPRLLDSKFPFVTIEQKSDGSAYIVLPADLHLPMFINHVEYIFGPGARALQLQVSPIPSQIPVPPVPRPGEHCSPQLKEIEKELWQESTFANIANFHTVADVDMFTAEKAWDPYVWFVRYRECEEKARREARTFWHNEDLCGMRVLVASSMMRFLSEDKSDHGSGTIKQVVRNKCDVDLSAVVRLDTIAAPTPRVGKTVVATRIPQPPASRRYHSTKVHVINMDCINAALQLQAMYSGSRVVVQNLASNMRPGGGWKRGRISQEEALFYRTALSKSLLQEFYENGGLGEFTCIYSRDVAVIREDHNRGYSFLPEDRQRRLDFVSLAAYNLGDPDANGRPQVFDAEKAARTRVKLESLFALCASQGADILVLGALGCGAFNNPSLYIAWTFRALIEQYAGYFSCIYFAILGSESDPKRADFVRVLLDGNALTLERCSERVTDVTKVADISLEYFPAASPDPRQQFLPPVVTDVTKPICPSAAGCREVNAQHYIEQQHPPFCPRHTCHDENEFHRRLFTHKTHCPNFVCCPLMYDANPGVVEEHAARFSHAQACQFGGRCIERDETHQKAFLHPPLCDKGLRCPYIHDAKHRESWRHLAADCRFGSHCAQFNDPDHMAMYMHPFIIPCPNTPFDCQDTSPQHLSEFAHMCPGGPLCSRISDPQHARTHIHVGAVCEDVPCTKLDEEHLGSHFHAGSSPFRPLCNVHWCTNWQPAHRRQFSHQPPSLRLSPVEMLNLRDPNCERFDRSSTGELFQVQFFGNVSSWIEKLDTYLTKEGGLDTSKPNFKEIVAWFKALRPVHMCSANIFKSMIRLGMAGSLVKLNSMWTSADEIVSCAMLRDSVRALAGTNPAQSRAVCKFAKRYVTLKQGVISSAKVPELAARIADPSKTKPEEVEKLKEIIKMFQRTPEAPIQLQRECQDRRIALVQLIGEDNVKKLEKELDDVVNAIALLVEKSPGIGYHVDRETRTNHTVFTIIGPHYGDYGGSEVVLIMRAPIMWHPDFYMLPCAATSFYSGRYNHNGTGMIREAWMGEGKPWQDGGKVALPLSKFHPMVPGWADAAAKEWICRVHFNKQVPVNDVKLSQVISLWTSLNSHMVTEGHLPGVVPLDYVEHVIITKAARESLKADPDIQAALDAWTQRFGANFIEECPDVNAVKERSGSYFLDTPCYHQPSGLCFVVSGGITEQFCPLMLPERDVVYLYFLAQKGGLFVTFSNVGYLVDDETKKREVVVFFIEEGTGNLSVYSKPPSICRASPQLFEMPRFNRSCPTKMFVHYMFKIDHARREITVKHWGTSRMYNKLELKVPMPAMNESYRYISFAADVTQPQIWDMVVLQDPRPEIELNVGTTSANVVSQQLVVTHNPQPHLHVHPHKFVKTDSAPQLTISSALSPVPLHATQVGPPNTQGFLPPPSPLPTQLVPPLPNPPSPLTRPPDTHPPPPSPPPGPPHFAPLPPQIQLQPQPQQQPQPPPPPPPQPQLQLPLCPTSPFTCPIYCNRNHPEHANHTQQCRHVCLYGMSCRDRQNPIHMATFIHLNKPVCTAQPCPNICDPDHRLWFAHPRKWDYLLPCKYGQGCMHSTNPDHCMQYYHCPFDYSSVPL